MTVEIAWNAAVSGWRALAALPTADGVFAWEQRGPADCFWWTGEPGRMAHQIFLASSAKGDLRDVLVAPNRPAVVRGIVAFEELRSESAPLMLCDLSTRDDVAPDRFDTILLTTEKQRRAALELLATVYADPGGLTAFFQGAGAAEIVGVYAENRLIASATVVSAGSVANIWSVATAEEARGKGAASAAVRAALRHVAASGHSFASLGTTGDLVSWYERFGFVQVGREYSARMAVS